MPDKKYRLISVITALALALGSFFSAGAKSGMQIPSLAPRTLYVSATGNDTDPGTATAPFKTFSKALSLMAAGDTLLIYGGTYTQQLNVSKSGTSSAPITIKAVSGQKVILDGGNVRDAPVFIPSTRSYVNLSGLTCKRWLSTCVLAQGSHLTISRFDVYEAKKFGIRVTGQFVTVEYSLVHDNVLENLGGANTTGGWGAGLRSAQGNGNNIFRYNEVFHNWGEGIIVGSYGTQVYGNKAYDNYSKNIYVGNTYNVDVYQNITHSTDSKWYRSGNPADCISMSEEQISSSYGAKLGNIRVYNNIAYNCKTGIGYTYTEVSGNGCDNCLISFNTITASKNACIKVIAGSKNHMEIANNICAAGSIDVPSGDISVHHNFTGDASLAGGAFGDPDSYCPLAESPVVGAGANTGVDVDFFNVSRDRFDIGAIQAETVAANTPTPTLPLPTASSTQPATPTRTVAPTQPTAIPVTPTSTIPASPTLLPPSPTITASSTLPPLSPTMPASATPTVAPPQPSPTSTSQPPSAAVTYDDKDPALSYSVNWTDVIDTKAYGGSFKKSGPLGSTAAMTFTGSSFTLLYTTNSTFGNMEVRVDGVLIGAINQYSASRVFNQKWDSPVTFGPGPHTLLLTHIGPDATRMTVDAITITP